MPPGGSRWSKEGSPRCLSTSSLNAFKSTNHLHTPVLKNKPCIRENSTALFRIVKH